MNMKSSKLYFNDYELWHPLLTLCFEKKRYGKYYKKIYINLKSVNLGLKPSFLWDLGPTPTITLLKTFVSHLKQKLLLSTFIFLFCLDQEIFIVNKNIVNETLSKVDFFKFINISSGILSGDSLNENYNLFKEIISQINSQLKENDKDCYTLSFPGCFLTKIFGIILGYPVVYNSDEDKAHNYLNFISLVNVKVFITVDSKDYEIYSFSHLPMQSLTEHVDKWFQNMKFSFNLNLSISKENVSFPTIVF